MTDIKTLTGAGRPLDRTLELRNAVTETIYRVGDGMPVASILGVLEIVKHEIIAEDSSR